MYFKYVVPICLALFLTGCSAAEESVTKYKFILPDGYRGVFKVVEDVKAGRIYEAPDGAVDIEVPPNGIVVLRSIKGFQEWHKAVAAYKSGGAISFGIGVLPDIESLAFFNLWTDQDGSIYYLIGTKAEYEKLQKGGPWKADDYLPKP